MSELSKENLFKIRQISITTTHLAEELLAGQYRSAFKGRGMEFDEVKQYTPGDDVRSIDWNVTARMNTPYVKSFQEERELTFMLVVDVSASTHFGSLHELKSDLMAEIGGIFAFSAIKNNDKVGLILFSDKIEKYIPPKKGSRHVMRVIREIFAFPKKAQKTNITLALSFYAKVQKKAGICFLISDFLAKGYEKEFLFVSKKHDLVAVQINDPYEFKFPLLKNIRLKDLETNELVLVDMSEAKVQQEYQQQAQQMREELKTLVKRAKASLIELESGKPCLPVLHRFFKERKAKR